MLLSGELIDAHTALQQGLITRVVEHDELAETTMRFARQVARPKARHAPADRFVSFTRHMRLSRGSSGMHKRTHRHPHTHLHVLAHECTHGHTHARMHAARAQTFMQQVASKSAAAIAIGKRTVNRHAALPLSEAYEVATEAMVHRAMLQCLCALAFVRVLVPRSPRVVERSSSRQITHRGLVRTSFM